MKTKHTTTASSIVAQARQARAAIVAPTVDPAAQTSRHGPFTLKSTSSSGEAASLRAIFARSDRADIEIDITFLLNAPLLVEPFSTAILIVGSEIRPSTLYLYIKTLRFFFDFMVESAYNLRRLEGIDSRLLRDYQTWLDQYSRKGKYLSRPTKNDRYRIVLRFVAALQFSPDWRIPAATIESRAPKGQSDGIPCRSDGQQPLEIHQLKSIVSAAEKEIRQISQLLDTSDLVLANDTKSISDGQTYYEDFLWCLARLANNFPSIIPHHAEIKKFDQRLYQSITKQHRGVQKFVQYLYSTPRDLIPFALLIAAHTSFNPDTILSLRWSEVIEVDRLGVPAIRVVGPKNRGSLEPRHRRQVALINAENGSFLDLRFVLETLRRLTKRIRSTVKPADQDLIFIFVPKTGAKSISRGFEDASGKRSADINWAYNLKLFCLENELPRFNLVQIRNTILDELHSELGDIAAVKTAANHLSTKTTWLHYTSARTRNKYLERLGEVLALKERWIESHGKIDPRYGTNPMGVSAATPGFFCFDAYDSPISGQVKGRLCSAYGMCPACPLAATNIGSARVVAQLRALRKAVAGSQLSVTPKVWALKWQLVIEELDSVLELVSEAVSLQADRISTHLPGVD